MASKDDALDAYHTGAQEALQRMLNHCATQIDMVARAHENNPADRGSNAHGAREGREQAASDAAYFVVHLASSFGVDLDMAKLDDAEERHAKAVWS